jgi:hypothetical protein
MKGTSIKCPHCGYGRNRVTRTMRLTVDGITHVRRYRRCLNPECPFSFRTREQLDESTTNEIRTEDDIKTDTTPAPELEIPVADADMTDVHRKDKGSTTEATEQSDTAQASSSPEKPGKSFPVPKAKRNRKPGKRRSSDRN